MLYLGGILFVLAGEMTIQNDFYVLWRFFTTFPISTKPELPLTAPEGARDPPLWIRQYLAIFNLTPIPHRDLGLICIKESPHFTTTGSIDTGFYANFLPVIFNQLRSRCMRANPGCCRYYQIQHFAIRSQSIAFFVCFQAYLI